MEAGRHRIGGLDAADVDVAVIVCVANARVSTRRGARRPEHGVTLVELMAVIAIVAVLATMAAPTFGSLRRTAGIGAAATELLAALHFARSAAALDGQPVTLCLSADGMSCVRSSADPANGWLVFAQPGAGVAPSATVVPPILRQGRIPEGVVVHGSRAAVTFWPATRASLTSTFDVCDVRRAVTGRAVVVSQTGRPRIAEGEASCGP